VFLVRGAGRWIAWAAIILAAVVTWFVGLLAAMAATRLYL
jgi:hypothetical protein